MRLLVTGFGPFKDVAENPSALLALAISPSALVFEVSFQAVEEFLNSLPPTEFEQWLMLGFAANRSRLCLETRAVNLVRGRDVTGVDRDGKIDESQPDCLSSTLWTPEAVHAITTSFPDEVQTSDDAGAYLCNYLLFRGITRFPNQRLGFLHIPPFDSIPFERQKQILSRIIGVF